MNIYDEINIIVSILYHEINIRLIDSLIYIILHTNINTCASLPSVTLGKYFTECFRSFTECLQSVPVVMSPVRGTTQLEHESPIS